MARYVTKDGYAARYSEEELLALTDRNGEGSVDEEVWSAAAEDAEAEVDAALASRYSLPLEHVPNAVRWAAYAVLRVRLNPHVGEDHPARQTYADARDWLRRVARGDASLGLTEDQAEDVGGSRPAVVGGCPQYTHSFFERYRR